MVLRGIVMDLDGTLIDSPLDFSFIRQLLGLAPDAPILEAIAARPKAEQEEMHSWLLAYELRAARDSRLFPGVSEFFSELNRLGLRTAIFSRNSAAVVQFALHVHGLIPELVVAR